MDKIPFDVQLFSGLTTIDKASNAKTISIATDYIQNASAGGYNTLTAIDMMVGFVDGKLPNKNGTKTKILTRLASATHKIVKQTGIQSFSGQAMHIQSAGDEQIVILRTKSESETVAAVPDASGLVYGPNGLLAQYGNVNSDITSSNPTAGLKGIALLKKYRAEGLDPEPNPEKVKLQTLKS